MLAAVGMMAAAVAVTEARDVGSDEGEARYIYVNTDSPMTIGKAYRSAFSTHTSLTSRRLDTLKLSSDPRRSVWLVIYFSLLGAANQRVISTNFIPVFVLRGCLVRMGKETLAALIIPGRRQSAWHGQDITRMVQNSVFCS